VRIKTIPRRANPITSFFDAQTFDFEPELVLRWSLISFTWTEPELSVTRDGFRLSVELNKIIAEQSRYSTELEHLISEPECLALVVWMRGWIDLIQALGCWFSLDERVGPVD